MLFGCFDEARAPGPLELGFIDRVWRDLPETFSSLRAHLLDQFPRLRN
jgi:hypothetical protein